jgi:Tfp pilus assembly protein PilN
MIAINLIPVELRKVDATPLPRRLTIFGAVALNAVGLVVALMYYFGTIPALQARKDAAQNQVYQATTINKVEQRYNDLIAQKRDFEQRRKTIEDIQKARVLWAAKLDQLWDLIPPEMWLSDIRLEDPPKPMKAARGALQPADDTPKGQILVIEGYTAGPDVSKISEFIKALETKKENQPYFFDEFEKIGPVQIELEEDKFQKYEEKVAMKFTLRLYMIPRQIELQPAPNAAAAPPNADK